MLSRSLLAAALALAATPALAASTTYELDGNHTQVLIRWNHFGFSNPSAQFGQVSGTLDFDAAEPTKAKLEAKVSIPSINSNVPDLNEHLAAADFFDAAKFPEATFVSTGVERGAAENQLRVTGDLTIHGVTKPWTLDVTVNKVGKHPMRGVPAAGFDAHGVIKRSEFGIDKYVPMIGDDVRVHITVEAIGKAEEPAAAKG